MAHAIATDAKSQGIETSVRLLHMTRWSLSFPELPGERLVYHREINKGA
jgi:hypothetical protein